MPQNSWLLVILYLCLMFAYVWTVDDVVGSRRRPEPWNDLPDPYTFRSQEPPSDNNCHSTRECPKRHACVGGLCHPILLRSAEGPTEDDDDRCDRTTGSWQIRPFDGKEFAVCECDRPHIYAQRHYGGNCNVQVACGNHGTYVPPRPGGGEGTCECREGYEPSPLPELACKKLSALDSSNRRDCDAGEWTYGEAAASGVFHGAYLSAHADRKCFRKPCEFDAATGRPLSGGRFVPAAGGCVCDPTRGLFGVRLDAMGEYLSVPGNDACASIYAAPGPAEREGTEVDLYAYFYMLHRKPVSFIRFRNVDGDLLCPELQGGKAATALPSPRGPDDTRTTFQISQRWPYDYAQHFLGEEEATKPHHHRVRTRACWDEPKYTITGKIHQMHCNEWEYEKPNSNTLCRDISTSTIKWGRRKLINYFGLLYRYPVCRFGPYDSKVHAIYRGRYVVNPYHAIVTHSFTNLFRSNGFVLRYENGEWTLDLAEPYDMKSYMQTPAGVPVENDELTERMDQNLWVHITPGAVKTVAERRDNERPLEEGEAITVTHVIKSVLAAA